jgi:spore coat protein JC
MWYYVKKFEHPVKVSRTDPRMAKLILAQYGGPNGELAAALRYQAQRYAMPDPRTRGLLIDIATEEMAHLEILGEAFYRLIEGLSLEELRRHGLDGYYTEFGRDVFYVNESGVPFTVAYIAAVGDPIANLAEDIAAEEKARTIYEHLINLTDDVDLQETLRFLWSREIVHSQRFREAKERVEDRLQERRIIVPGERVERTTRNERLTWSIGEMCTDLQ